jgi:hypothetical protein
MDEHSSTGILFGRSRAVQMVMRAGSMILIGFLVLLAGCGHRRGGAARAAVPPLYEADAAARTIPSGERLVLSVIPRGSRGKASSTMDAVVMRDVLDGAGRVMIGKGSPATLTILDGKPALRSVMVYGNAYRVVATGSDRAAPLEIVSKSSSPSGLRFTTNEIVNFRTSTNSLLVSSK